MTFESKCLKHITKLDPAKKESQKVLTIMQYGNSIQLVNQEYWYDKEEEQHKPGKLKGFTLSDLEKIDDIGLEKIIRYISKNCI